MKQSLKFIIPLTLLLTFFLAACEVPRPGGEEGDISVATPEIITPPAEPPTEAPSPTPGLPPDIDPAGVRAPDAPDVAAVEPGKVLLKLSQQAAIQARSAELGSDNIVVAGIASLDQRLREIGASELQPVLEEVAGVIGQDIESLSAQAEQVAQLYSVSFAPDRNPADVVTLLADDPSVEYAEPNYIAGIAAEPYAVPLAFEPNDQYFRFQWNFQTIQMQGAWDLATGQDVIVAVVDTGIDFKAPDLANANRLPGFDFVNNDTDPTDDQSHGTHVAGTIAQSTNNGIGVTGVAFNARLLPVKVLGADGNGSYENIIKGITYAVNQGAKVINLSLAGRNGSQGLRDAVKFARDRGVVVVAAAGNSGSAVAFPAAYDEYVIAVGATRFDNTRSSYSNFGPEIDFVAPGGDIDQDQNGDSYADGILQQTFKSVGSGYTYLFLEGTSMAAPHVAGLSALLLSRKPNASPAEIETIMAQTARNLGSPNEYGAGLIQAAAAVAALAPAPQTPTATPLPPTVTTAPPTVTPVPPTFTPQPPTVTPLPPTVTPLPPTQQPVQVTVTPTPTPLPPPTATFTPAAPLPASELLQNGNFESTEGWTFGDTPVRGDYDGAVVLDGQRSLRLGITSGGGDAYSFTSAWQQVTIPNEAKQAALTANVYLVSQDSPGTDSQNILILDRNFRIIKTLMRELSNSQIWESRQYDLSEFAGKTIYIYFGVFNRGASGKPTGMYVDSVSLRWAP